jgi:hypothetical protein
MGRPISTSTDLVLPARPVDPSVFPLLEGNYLPNHRQVIPVAVNRVLSGTSWLLMQGERRLPPQPSDTPLMEAKVLIYTFWIREFDALTRILEDVLCGGSMHSRAVPIKRTKTVMGPTWPVLQAAFGMELRNART